LLHYRRGHTAGSTAFRFAHLSDTHIMAGGVARADFDSAGRGEDTGKSSRDAL
jgi:hypothetical protein